MMDLGFRMILCPKVCVGTFGMGDETTGLVEGWDHVLSVYILSNTSSELPGI